MKHKDEVCVHKDCNEEVRHIGEDGIDFCPMCEVICEGQTEYITEEEYERRQNEPSR